MTTSDSTPAAVLVAIDIAKVRNEVLIEASGHKRRRRLLVLNTRTEHDHLIEVLQAYGRPVVCAFEATGNYHRPIAWRLAEAGLRCGWCRRWRWPEHEKRCTIAGTRTIQRMHR